MFEDWNYLPCNVTKQIFSLLNYKDIMNATLVCSKWNDYIGRMPECMDKVRLKIEGWHDLEVISQRLTEESPRIYSSIMLYNINPERKFPYLLLQKWKDVKLVQMKFMSSTIFCDYVLSLGDSLQTFHAERIFIIRANEPCQKSLDLPKLKHLTLMQVPSSAFQVFGHCLDIRTLHFEIPAFGSLRRADISEFFKNFRGSTKMEKLTITRNSLYALSIETQHIMESVIVSMRALKEIVLNNWGYCHTLEEIWDHMEATHFAINICSHKPLVQNLLQLTPNVHLTSFELSLVTKPETAWFRQLFLLAPNLEELSISLIRKQIVHAAATFLRKLKKFSYNSCTIDRIMFGQEVMEAVDEDPGLEYSYLGRDEIFDDRDIPLTHAVRTYEDTALDISFAHRYYGHLKTLDPSINPEIQIRKKSNILS